MGTKYSSQSASGYNASPPSDDGSTTTTNKITWGTAIKGKLADPLYNWISSIQTTLINALNFSFSTTSTAYTTVAADHCTVVEVSGTTTVSLGDAATMAAGYVVGVCNKGTAVVTVALITAANTMNGNANGTVKLLPGQCMVFGINQAVSGYDIVADTNRSAVVLTGVAGTNTVTAGCDSVFTALSANQVFVLTPANTNTGATTLNVTPSGGSALTAKNVFSSGAACIGGELVAGAPSILVYDGTQFNIIGIPRVTTLATPQASTSGTAIDFLSIPAGVKRITVMFVGVSTNGTSNILVQVGKSGGVENTGYTSYATTSSGGTSATSTAGFIVGFNNAAVSAFHGRIALYLENASANTWVAVADLYDTNANTSQGMGSKSLAGTLDRVRITAVNGTDAFDAGEINISYGY